MIASNGVLQGSQDRPRIAAGSGHSSKLFQPEKSKESAGFDGGISMLLYSWLVSVRFEQLRSKSSQSAVSVLK